MVTIMTPRNWTREIGKIGGGIMMKKEHHFYQKETHVQNI